MSPEREINALSTATSHRVPLAVLGEIRKRCTEKLARIPLGAVLDQSSGALKNTLIKCIDSIETTRMGLASLVTLPLGLSCYVLMMTGSAKFYAHTVTATKTLNDTAVEYIGGIQVIKVFGKTKSSYDRFVHDAYDAAHSFIDWMRASIPDDKHIQRTKKTNTHRGAGRRKAALFLLPFPAVFMP